ncbi:DUF6928 family protein [Thermomonospora cellulosilytica]|uniref:Uncharacterized protein n=1 Tax=Thermomonospora cellulosilytica TaxID=1411118 RepID=A0A7W3MYL8_9ACTN|nr:hypothetical protein [Thermomonospora cellulosilytica]MBA9004222.1 hypothetical protein [Thermomonospora cellulosilytica]
MGAKTALLVYADGDAAELLRNARSLDPVATDALVARTNPDGAEPTGETGTLADYVYPDEGSVYAGCFPGVSVLCDRQVMVDRPSQLPPHLLEPGRGRRVVLHAMHSVTDWFAYAIWENGTLVRSLSLSPDEGIVEDIGDRLAFEEPFWAGEHPVTRTPGWPNQSPYPLPFHPLVLGGEAALRALLGFVREGRRLTDDLDAHEVPLARYRVPVTEEFTREELEEFLRTHKRTRYTFNADGALVPIED